jgi:glutathione S-transferase
MPLVIYGAPVSQPARAVMWLCMMHALPFQLNLTVPGQRSQGGAQSTEYLRINPWGNIPSIDDDGFTLYEANTIMCYLADKHGWTDVYPTDLRQRARVNQYLHWHHEHSRKLSLNLIAPVLRRIPASPKDEVLLTEAKNVLWDLETYKGSNAFMCGDAPTLADISAYCEVGQLQPQFLDMMEFTEFGKLQAWMARMQTLVGHDEAHAGLSQFAPKFKALQAKRAASSNASLSKL